MREIKFRAWDKNAKRMIGWYDRGFLNETIFNNGSMLCEFPLRYANSDSCMWIYMQYTGLKDKNGVEIYEGDIVEREAWHGEIDSVMAEQAAERNGKKINWTVKKVILWHPTNGTYIWRKFNDLEDMVYVGDIFTGIDAAISSVIGNIYENPELLKAGEEAR